jgi:hypothetical protein
MSPLDRATLAARPKSMMRTWPWRSIMTLPGGQAADLLQQIRQRVAVHVLHRDERRAVGVADVVHAADVGMRDLTCEPNLGPESLEQPGVVRRRGRQELQRDDLIEREVECAIDLAHPAVPDGIPSDGAD